MNPVLIEPFNRAVEPRRVQLIVAERRSSSVIPDASTVLSGDDDAVGLGGIADEPSDFWVSMLDASGVPDVLRMRDREPIHAEQDDGEGCSELPQSRTTTR